MCEEKKLSDQLIVAATKPERGSYLTKIFKKDVYAAILRKLVVKESLIKKLQEYMVAQDSLFQENQKTYMDLYWSQKRNQ